MKRILLIGCSSLVAYLGSAVAQQLATSAPGSDGGFSGKVIETMNAGEYTYLRVDTGKTNFWAAAPRFPVKVGDTASIAAGMPMPQYHSKTLNRDFEIVYFTDRVVVNGTLPAVTVKRELPLNHPPIGEERDPAGKNQVDLSGIKKAQGGKTVAEVYAQKDQLGGQQIKVRGKVVKYHGGILGKNWIHLRDGTGSEGSNDLLVTSSSKTKVGETVVATGTVALNKNFGLGYKYSVMMEDAKILVE